MKDTLRPVATVRLPAEPTELAGLALNYLAADPERLDRFLALTGLTPQTIRRAAEAPGFVGDLLGYLGSDEALLRDFAAAHKFDPSAVDAARIRFAPRSDYDRE